MADRVGFEPTKGVNPCRFSRAVPSTTRPPVQRKKSLPMNRLGYALRQVLTLIIGKIGLFKPHVIPRPFSPAFFAFFAVYGR